jgi:hypothetical protein
VKNLLYAFINEIKKSVTDWEKGEEKKRKEKKKEKKKRINCTYLKLSFSYVYIEVALCYASISSFS